MAVTEGNVEVISEEPEVPKVLSQHQSQPTVRKSRVLVVGDENLSFSARLQKQKVDKEITGATCLSRSELEAEGYQASPQELEARVRHLVNPCRLGKTFHQYDFDELVSILPGLSFKVPEHLQIDSPIFTYRIHLFLFHLIRHAKLVLKDGGFLHILWPSESGLADSPFGASGIDLSKVVRFCRLEERRDAGYDLDGLIEGFKPYINGEIHEELPQWCRDAQFRSFVVTRTMMSLPLSIALTMHPDTVYVAVEGEEGTATRSPGEMVGLRNSLAKRATKLKEKLKGVFEGKSRNGGSLVGVSELLGFGPAAASSDATVLEIPSEIFALPFKTVPHICELLRFQVFEDQTQVSVGSIEVLDPRLPTYIDRDSQRPPPQTARQAIPNIPRSSQKRQPPLYEEWGGMPFYCSLTKLCTSTAENMRLHMDGEYYKKLAAQSKDWDTSPDKRWLLEKLRQSESGEVNNGKRMKTSYEERGRT